MKLFLNKLVSAGLAILFVMASCQVLDQEPIIQLETTNAITDRASAYATLNGLYDALQDEHYYGGIFVIATDMFTEDLINTAFEDSYRELSSQYVPTTNLYVYQIWMQMYRAINIANTVITRVPLLTESEMPADEKLRVLGAAKFIRGLVYFDLLRTFGEHWNINSGYGVPVRIQPALKNEFTPRSTVAQTYQRIIDDLLDAEDALDDVFNPAYATKTAAKALLARVYLYKKEYQRAIDYASEVINSGHFVLLEEYAGIFNSKNSRESIFELNFNLQDQSYFLQEFGETDEASISYDLHALFDEEDERRELIVNDLDLDFLLTTNKYEDQQASAYIIRLAEMYTIRAEASVLLTNQITAGLPDVNQLRIRAGIDAIMSVYVPDIPHFMDLLFLEKRKEFFAEGHRFYDLARHQKMDEVYGIENFRAIFPIPYLEVLTAQSGGYTLMQNPGF